MEHYGIIYKIENRINHKVYIGQTTNSLTRRYGKRLQQVKNPGLKAAIAKYGLENFTVEIIDSADSQEELDALEIDYIAKYDSTNKTKGYNLDLGGHNALHCEETKEKIRQANLGEKNPNYGKRGKDNPKYSRVEFTCDICGKPITRCLSVKDRSEHHYCSHACRIEGSKTLVKRPDNRVEVECDHCKQVIKRYPSEIKDKKYIFCSKDCQNAFYVTLYKGKNNPNYDNHKVAGGNNGRARKVLCVETGVVYECARDADKVIGARIGSVGAVCRGDQKSTRGLHFRYCE